MVAFIPSTLFSQSVADPVIPDGDYFLLWTSWPDRYLTGSNKATYDKTGLVDVTFQPKSYSSSTSDLAINSIVLFRLPIRPIAPPLYLTLAKDSSWLNIMCGKDVTSFNSMDMAEVFGNLP